jgi:hypothetical protein
LDQKQLLTTSSVREKFVSSLACRNTFLFDTLSTSHGQGLAEAAEAVILQPPATACKSRPLPNEVPLDSTISIQQNPTKSNEEINSSHSPSNSASKALYFSELFDAQR